MRRNDTPAAFVIGSSCTEVVRPLALAGIPCRVVATPEDGVQYSRHARRAFDWNWELPLDAHDDRLVGRLLDVAHQEPAPPVLYFCSEQALIFTSRFRTELADAFRFTLPPAPLVEDLADKERFHGLSTRLALPVPATRVVEPGGFARLPVEDLAFPLIIKPHLRYAAWTQAQSGKAVRVDDVAALGALAPSLDSSGLSFVLQQCIDGPESAVESYHVYVAETGQVRAEFTGRKIRTLPAQYGYSTALTLTDAGDVRALGRELVDALELRGVAKLDFKRAESGRLYLLEVNARFNLWHHLGAYAGVNLPALVYGDLTGEPVPSPPAVPPTGISWVHPLDLVAARQADEPFLRWLRWAAGCPAKAFWAWDDPLPLVAVALARLRARLRTAPERPES
jgi:predicted ATP-grasp superfamily ATP-dependent carboligase